MVAAKRTDAVSLGEACDFVPRHGGKRIHKSTLIRWRDVGVRAVDGQRVRLKTLRVGGRVYVRLADLQTFLDRLNQTDQDTPVESDADRLRRSREAGAALEAMGC